MESDQLIEPETPTKSDAILPGISASPFCATCGSGGYERPLLVYAVGRLDVDFLSSSHLASVAQRLGFDPSDHVALVKHLKENPADAESLAWVLTIEETPAYHLVPAGAFARETYAVLVEFLDDMTLGVERISAAGVATGGSRLASGIEVPRLVPELRGLASWTTDALGKVVVGEKSGESIRRSAITDFLHKIYFELRSLGRTPAERAINFVATEALTDVNQVFGDALNRRLQLDRIEVEPAPIAWPGREVLDVKLIFFDAENTNHAGRVYRMSVDVSPHTGLPVRVGGSFRSWPGR
jgi:hypothetical protein